MPNNKLLSFVIPAYCEQENLRPTYQAIKSIMEKNLPDYSWEIIFVDDGSHDSSFKLINIFIKAENLIRKKLFYVCRIH